MLALLDLARLSARWQSSNSASLPRDQQGPPRRLPSESGTCIFSSTEHNSPYSTIMIAQASAQDRLMSLTIVTDDSSLSSQCFFLPTVLLAISAALVHAYACSLLAPVNRSTPAVLALASGLSDGQTILRVGLRTSDTSSFTPILPLKGDAKVGA
ncbi:hypothetical protein PLICRDRAFT_276187 [Plicaturopsis crispa FD-325 SS-3]|nr:hypothetical protein PLICRDRAFT_276187 [Plicaturopsis crispa FD-325 SS-3]